jgi:MtN3 and saliva related transmembrane protein
MSMITLLGFVAGALTTVSFVPQAVKTWRSRHCDDLSWGMLILFAAGVGAWLAYGLITKDLPIIAANAVTLALVLMIVAMKWAFGSTPRAAGDQGKH